MMIDLEYVLIYGVPGNKLEVIEGKTRCSACFPTREEAEAHFHRWIDTICRWKQVARPPITLSPAKGHPDGGPTGRMWEVEVAGIEIELDLCRIDLALPIECSANYDVWTLQWCRDLWPEAGTGWAHGDDTRMGIYMALGGFPGKYSGRVDLLLTDRTCVAPDGYYFRPGREGCLVRDSYFEGVPDLIVESLTPPSVRWDRGERMALYEAAGVPEVWILDPHLETVETFVLVEGRYRAENLWRPGDRFYSLSEPNVSLDGEELFHPFRRGTYLPGKDERTPPPPAWVSDRTVPLPLQELLIFGHPDRRFEYWNGRAICVLAFGSEEEALYRMGGFMREAGQWEGVSPAGLDIGKFHFRQEGPRVYLEVDVDPAVHRQYLRYWHFDGNWDSEIPFEWP